MYDLLVFMIFWNNLTEISMIKFKQGQTASAVFYLTPTVKDSSQRLRRKTFQLPLVITEYFKNCFVNRLCFNYNLAVCFYYNIVIFKLTLIFL